MRSFDAQSMQMAISYPQAFAVATQNSSAFMQLASQPAALQLFAANVRAFEALGHDANFQPLVGGVIGA